MASEHCLAFMVPDELETSGNLQKWFKTRNSPKQPKKKKKSKNFRPSCRKFEEGIRPLELNSEVSPHFSV